MMVGDNLKADIEGCQSLGIYGVWVDWTGRAYPWIARLHRIGL